MESAGRIAQLSEHGDLLGPGSAPDLLKALTAHTPVGVFVSDQAGACVYVNERWSELTGLSFAEALGDGWSVAVHPDDRERVAAEWAAASVEGRDSVVEYRFLRGDGSVTWVKGYASAVYATEGLVGWVGSLLEVTEYRTAMQALTSERETLRASFDDAPSAMALVDPSGRFLRVNAALCEIVGYEAEALLQLNFQDITHPDDLDADIGLVQQLLAGEIHSYRLEKRYIRPDRNAHWASISVSLIRREDGAPLHFVVHVEDIDQRKRAERRLHRQANHDSLTGLPNRRRLLEELKLRCEQVDSGTVSAHLIMIDLDQFKDVNDRYGHTTGDRVLVAAARALRRAVRETDLVARLGGDEFAVIAATEGDPDRADVVAGELLRAVRAWRGDASTPKVELTASAGIAAIRVGSGVAGTLEEADRALYRAKQSGRDRVAQAESGSA